MFSWVSGNRQGGLARGAGPIACNPLSSRRAKRRGVEAFNVSSARPSRRAPPKSSPCSSRGRPRWSCPRAASRQGRPAGGGAVARGRLARGPLCVAMHGPTPAHGGSSKHPELTTHANTRAPRLPSPTLRPLPHRPSPPKPLNFPPRPSPTHPHPLPPRAARGTGWPAAAAASRPRSGRWGGRLWRSGGWGLGVRGVVCGDLGLGF